MADKLSLSQIYAHVIDVEVFILTSSHVDMVELRVGVNVEH